MRTADVGFLQNTQHSGRPSDRLAASRLQYQYTCMYVCGQNMSSMMTVKCY